ncbi:glycoside hydrolase family 3 protein [Mycena alexandri]|uniref:beta-glucosidase n=1 Tax=Mycena alexandri TaxID=1745969 RepID=A0AAD6TGA7_9AGAR|nr:glycoside hydrolase family 3 protein [Mycena alexandri]
MSAFHLAKGNTRTMDIDHTLSKLTLVQKVKLLTGSGWWHTEAIPEAGVPAMRMSDGPNGVRGTRFFNGVPSSCFPASSGIGSSFDVDLAREVGKALADESRAKGCHILLAPTVNTQRSPLGGRGFESFSEDPLLNGNIAAAYINGLQSNGVSATIKHFVANDQEFQRFSISSDVSERALREIYLKPFQIAIRDANPWALMTAYNRVNGLHISESKKFLEDILRNEWGYKGMIMSDWTGVYSTAESIQAGLDLEMPGPSVMRGHAVVRCLMAEKLFPGDIDARVRKILELVKHAQNSGIPFNAPEESVDTPALRALLRTAAADSIVLLKNSAGLLPLSSTALKKIAVIGPNAKTAMTSGGGSARLLSTYTVSPLEGIAAAAKELGGDVEVKYALGAATHRFLPLLDGYIRQSEGGEAGAVVEFWNEAPSGDFLATDADLGANLTERDWSTPTLGTNCFLMDGIDATKVNVGGYIRYSAIFTPDESGDWELSVNIAGRGNLFLDNSLLVDLSTNPEPGESWFGFGTADKRAVAKGLEANKAYKLELRINTIELVSRGLPFPCWGGIRIGGSRQFDEKEAIKEAAKLAKESDVAILVIGLNHDWESEGFDRRNIDLPLLTNPLVTAVLRANPKTVVVNQSGTPVAMPWIAEASTIVQAFYGGNELGSGLADVLWGKVNPSAKVSLSFPERLEDTPSFTSFGDKGQEPGKILYNEGIFVGYRGYEIMNTKPLFPFGFGLSYSTFEYSDLRIAHMLPDGTFSITFKLKNTSSVPGREVAQVYIADSQASLPRPLKELKGFIKVSLQAGETRSVTMDLNREALGFYDERRGCWVAEKGTFEVLVGASSSDVRLKGEVELDVDLMWTGL